MSARVIVVGSGNAGLCAGIAACEAGAEVLVLEKGAEDLSGGNTKYTAGAMRFAYDGPDDLKPLIKDPSDPRLARTDLGHTPPKSSPATCCSSTEGGLFRPNRNALSTSRSPRCIGWRATA